jgi:conjugative transposon TraN protein
MLRISFFLLPIFVFAQDKLDTIRVSFSKTVILVFDSKITFDNLGSEDVIAQKKDNKILLAAAVKKFPETNLHIETESGYYSFIILYQENPKKLFYNFNKSHSVLENSSSQEVIEVEEESKEILAKSVQKPSVKPSTGTASTNAQPTKKTVKPSKEDLFANNCKSIHDKSNSYKSIGVLGNKMFWSLGDIYVKEDHLYFKVSANNSSNIKYDIDLIKFVTRSSSGKIKQKAEQEDIIEPTFVYNGEKMVVDGKSTLTKVFVFPKFTIDDEKKLFVELWEVGGDRKLEFSITNKEIIRVKNLD